MKQLLNTLYVTTQGAYLAKDGETVQVRVEHETRCAFRSTRWAASFALGRFRAARR